MLKITKGIFVSERSLLVIFAFFIVSIFAIVLQGSVASADTSINSDFEVKVDEVLELSVATCNSVNGSLVSVDVIPTTAGTFKSNCQNVAVNTNNPGYYLAVKSASSNLIYQNPTTVTPAPTIPSTTNSIASPDTIVNNTWGFAAENRINFPTNYMIDDSSDVYAALPTSDVTVYSVSQWPILESTHKFFYATKLTPETMAGTYMTTITYTAVGEYVTPAPKSCVNAGTSPECIEFIVNVTNTGTYSIPTSGMVTGSAEHTYNWDVYIDGYLTNACQNGNCSGTGAQDSNGIVINGLSNGTHQILIVPHDNPAPGWGNAFGYNTPGTGANTEDNKGKITSLVSPLTTMAFAPKTTESTTNASYMFASIFYECAALTTPAKIIDTYKLPDTITNLNSFLYSVHWQNLSLLDSLDLSGISGWINTNNTITSMTRFLGFAHFYNTSNQNAIDLSSLANWFDSNTSILFLDNFLSGLHWANTELEYPIDLSPLTNWFKFNDSIFDLSSFLARTHTSNSSLVEPIDVTPLKNWFSENRSMFTLTDFMNETHSGNENLTLTGQVILPNWIKTMTDGNNTPVWNTGANINNFSFYKAFSTIDTKTGDTAEVRFEDGDALSSLGSPNINRETYSNRSGIVTENSNWK